MKIKILVCWLIVSSLMLLSVACTRKVTETSVTSTEAATETISTTLGEVTETIDPFLPPSPQELAKNNFALPDISRVLCEQLKMMMDEGNNFVLVDTRTNATFKLGFLPGAINIPEDDSSPLFTEEWVNNQLKTLPTNRMIIFYCDWPDDGEAASLAEKLIQLRSGDKTNIKILWKGYYRWLELGYPTVK